MEVKMLRYQKARGTERKMKGRKPQKGQQCSRGFLDFKAKLQVIQQLANLMMMMMMEKLRISCPQRARPSSR
jgi:hypothetical protein